MALKILSSKIAVVGKKNKEGKPSKGVENFVLCKLQLWGRKTKGGRPGKGALLVLKILSSKIAVVGEKNQKCLFTDSLHRLGSRFARTSSVPLEISKMIL